MPKEEFQGPLERVNDYCWRIPKHYRSGMRVDGLIYADDRLMEFIRKDQALAESAVRRLIEGYHFTISNMSYRLSENGTVFEYRMVIKTSMKENLERLAASLRARDDILEFRISPTGD